MIRIVAGEFKGRRLPLPPGDVRPTSAKAREAVFDILESRMSMNGARFLDWFAGSGAVGFEALSRGADFVEFVEANGKVFSHLKRIVQEFHVEHRCAVTRSNIPAHRDFDACFADPPYADSPDLSIVPKLVKPGGYFMFENSGPEPSLQADMALVRKYHYGRTNMFLFMKETP